MLCRIVFNAVFREDGHGVFAARKLPAGLAGTFDVALAGDMVRAADMVRAGGAARWGRARRFAGGSGNVGKMR